MMIFINPVFLQNLLRNYRTWIILTLQAPRELSWGKKYFLVKVYVLHAIVGMARVWFFPVILPEISPIKNGRKSEPMER